MYFLQSFSDYQAIKIAKNHSFIQIIIYLKYCSSEYLQKKQKNTKFYQCSFLYTDKTNQNSTISSIFYSLYFRTEMCFGQKRKRQNCFNFT